MYLYANEVKKMSLYKKTMLMAIAAIAITLSLITFSAYELLTKIALQNEEEIASHNISQVQNEISSIVNSLSIVATDYGRWDDTFSHMENFNEEYINSNYMQETFINNRFEILFLVDDLGNINFQKAYNLESEEEIPIPEDLKEEILEHWSLLYNRSGKNINGIILLPDSILAISSQPILTSRGEGPARGALIMARYINDNMLYDISNKVKLPITITNLSDSSLQDEWKMLTNISKNDNIYIKPLSKETTSVYSVMKDLIGEDSLLLQVDFPRTFFLQNLQSIVVFIFLAILSCLIIFMIFLMFLHKVVLNPLSQFSKEIVSIGNEENFAQRLNVTGRDELALLGNSVNSMLSSLESSHRKIAAITEAIPGLVYIFDLQKMQNIYFNNQMTSILGYSQKNSEDILNRNFLLLVHPDDLERVNNHYYQLIEANSNDSFSIEYRAKHKDGHYIWLSANDLIFQRTEDGEVESVLGIAQDITAKKLAEEELLQAKLSAEAANKAKSQFLANMSHELRTPMNGIIGLTEILSLTPLNDEQKEYIDLLQFSNNRLLSVINDILDISKIESQKLSLEAIPFNLHSLISSVVKDFSLRASKKGLELTHRIDDNIPISFIGDPHRLNQVLYNLLGNALKFTNEGTIHLEVTAEKSYASRYLLLFSIKDTGIGIPKDKRHFLFDNFTQVDASTTRKYGGTGLGLAISKKLVELMGGSIGVDSQEGEGSVFTFSIPLLVDASIPLHDEANVVKTPEEDGANNPVKILLVEDDLINQKLTKTLLLKKGWHVTTASNGDEALEILQNHSFNCIIMDLQMPIKDGFETTMMIREKEQNTNFHIPIIALTANASIEDREKCLSIGMDSFMSKPVVPKNLYNTIEEILKK